MSPSIRKLTFVAVALTICSGLLIAQDPAAAPHHGKSWLELFEATGTVGYLLLLTSIIGTALVIEHCTSIRRDKIAPPDLIQELEALIEAEDYQKAIEVCDDDQGYVCNLIGNALRMRHAGYEEMIGVLEQTAAEETFKLQTKISYLSLLGNVAPLLGLLGTVTGMISSFQVIEQLKAPTPKDLAVGVYESLVNTTLGLFLAIIFLTAYFVFKNKVTKMTLSVNLQSVEMLRSLVGKITSHKHTTTG
jgi:biopolymer transport protein ExbB